MTNGQASQDELLLGQLRDILLTDDRAEIEQLKKLLHDREMLSEHLGPILEERLDFMRQNFPKEYKKTVARIVDEQIKNSQQEIVDVLYPVLGNLIKKYIDFQMQLLKESIEAQITATKQKFNFWSRIKNKIKGVSETDLAISDARPLVIHQVFLIEKNSGIVLAQAAKKHAIDSESVAGMLTAIKSFAEDAFGRGEEMLDLIQYQQSKILIQNYMSYYMALVAEGPMSSAEREKLVERLEKFMMQEFVQVQNRRELPGFYEDLSGEIDRWFIKPTLLIEKGMSETE
jgi:hypothetical protein